MSKNRKKKDYRKYLLISVIVLAVIINGIAFYVNRNFDIIASAEDNLAAVSTNANPVVCQDSDGPKNFYFKGKTYGNTGSGARWYTDSCFNGNTVKEYSCMSNVYPKVNKPLDIWTDIYKCPNGCSDGKCSYGPTLTLLGSDISNSAGTGANDDMGTFKIRFNVRAIGSAIYVPATITAATTVSGYNGRSVVVVDRAGVATKGGISVALANTSDTTLTNAGNYKIEDGHSENFEITVTAQLPTAGQAGLYRASLKGLAWSLTDISPVTNLYTSTLDSFKTAYNGLN